MEPMGVSRPTGSISLVTIVKVPTATDDTAGHGARAVSIVVMTPAFWARRAGTMAKIEALV
ncbi:hypothetical protein GCM10010412_035420 [Nonomuraea recticatena]|uniref:Uncharacterized protein n=1 Tax=Nonomuraea recticatena TaxID=46178 RepID=A0ABP6E9B9_9ACTN